MNASATGYTWLEDLLARPELTGVTRVRLERVISTSTGSHGARFAFADDGQSVRAVSSTSFSAAEEVLNVSESEDGPATDGDELLASDDSAGGQHVVASVVDELEAARQALICAHDAHAAAQHRVLQQQLQQGASTAAGPCTEGWVQQCWHRRNHGVCPRGGAEGGCLRCAGQRI